MKNILLGFLKALKFPLKLLKGWLKKKPKLSKREKNLRAYVRNFSPGRLKNISYQKSDKKAKKTKHKFSNKKVVK